MTYFIIAYHISLVNVQNNYCNNNLLIMDLEQLNKIMKLYYFYTLKALWCGQGKIKMYYGMFRVKKQLLGKRSIKAEVFFTSLNELPPMRSTFEILESSLLKIFSSIF